MAANALVGVATANLYPSFGLTSSGGFESGALESLFNWQSRVWSIAEGIVAPIFEGGRLRASLDATKAEYRQVVAAYVNQVLIAYGYVEDALTDLHALTDQAADLREAVAASRTISALPRFNTEAVWSTTSSSSTPSGPCWRTSSLQVSHQSADERQHPFDQGAWRRMAGSTMRCLIERGDLSRNDHADGERTCRFTPGAVSPSHARGEAPLLGSLADTCLLISIGK